MTIQHVTTEYMIPRGDLLIDILDANLAPQGEEEFGETPGCTINISTDKIEEYSSRTASAEKVWSRTVKIARGAKLTVKNCSIENLARFLAGAVETISQSSGSVTDAVMTVTPGKQYQLGQAVGNASGDRNVSSLVVKDSTGTTTYAEGTDYNADLVRGRIQIISGGTIAAGQIKVSYTKAADSWKRIKTNANTEITCALRVVADNSLGDGKDYYLTYCKMRPSGDLPTIQGDAKVVEMTFDVDVLTPANDAAIYCDGSPVAA